MGILGKNFLHTVASNLVLKFVVGLVISIVTARVLGAEGRGEYNLLVLIITSVSVMLNFGLPATNTYFTAQKRFTREQLIRSSAILAFALGFAALGLLYLFHVVGWFGVLFPSDKLSAGVVAALGVLPFVFLNLFVQGIIVGENRIQLNNYISVGAQTALAFGILTAHLLGALTVPVAILLYAAMHVGTTVALKFIFVPGFGSVLGARLTKGDYKTLLRFSSKIHIGNLTQFFNYRLDAFIVNYFLGAAAVGVYGIAFVLGETLWVLGGSMAAVLLPTIAGAHEKSRELTIKAAAATFVVSFLGGIGAALAGPFLIVPLFGEEFAGAVAPFLILIPGIVIFSLTNVLATFITAQARPGINAAIAFVSFLFTLILNILLIPEYGISGAAFASSVSYTISSLLTMVAFLRLSKMSFREVAGVLGTMRSDLESIHRRLKERLPGSRRT